MTTLDASAILTRGSRLPLDDGTLAVLVGIPGCGKSTFASQYPTADQLHAEGFTAVYLAS